MIELAHRYRPFRNGEQSVRSMEKHFNARYVMDVAPIGQGGSFVNAPMSVFYADEKHPQGSHFFGLTICDGGTFITDALPHITGRTFLGVRVVGGKVMYSSYRHDYVVAQGGSTYVDGGSDYFRTNAKESDVICFSIRGDGRIGKVRPSA